MKKRLLSLFLTIVMVVGLLPATALPVAAADSGDKTEDTNVSGSAFGIPTPGFSPAEQAEAEAGAPFGPVTKGENDNKTVTIFERPELFLSYGWDGTYNNNRIYDYNGSNGKDTTSFKSRFSSFDNNSITANLSPDDTHIVFAQTDSFSTGSQASGQRGNAFVAMVSVDSNYREYLRTFDSSGKKLSQLDLGNVSYTKMDAYQGKDYLDVACGDFDGDGVDEIAVFNGEQSRIEYYTVYDDGRIKESSKDNAKIIVNTSNKEFGDTNNVSIDHSDGDNHIKVQLVAADTDRDGLDELIVTSSGNDYDNKGSIDGYDASTMLTIFDWQKEWEEPSGEEGKTEKHGPGLRNVFQQRFTKQGGDNPFSNDMGMCWGSSDVGFLIPEEGIDFPEIITAGFGNKAKDSRDVDLDEDTIQYVITRYNYRSGKYEMVHKLSSREVNDFTTGGIGGNYVNPLLPVACFNYMGGAEAEAIFISGTVYCIGQNGNLREAYKDRYFDDDDDGHGAAIINRDVIASFAVGNFDGNDIGSEQIIFSTMLKQESTNNSYCRLYTYYFNGPKPMQPDGEDNVTNNEDWHCMETSDFIGHKGRAYVTLTAMDTGNDSTVGYYKSVEKKWSNPDVMVILEATPYFAEKEDGDVANSATQFSTTKGSAASSGHSNNFNFNIHAGFELDEVFEMSLTTSHSFTWATMNTTSQEFTQDWENDTGENMVAVYRAPVYIYTYHDINSNSDIYIQKTMQPAFNLISVKDYNEQCAAYKNLTKITEGTGQMLCEPGNPFSYPATQTTLLANNQSYLKSSRDASDLNTGSYWIQYSGGGTMTQEYQYATETEKSFTYEFSVDVDATAKFSTSFGKVSVGGGAGYGHTVDSSTVNTNGTTKSGSVTCQGDENYDFQWQLAHWTIDLNGKAVPVVGYLVRNPKAPPTPADDLNVESIGSTDAVITWADGSRPADEYRIYRYVEGEKDELRLIGVERGNAEGQYRYELTGLQPGATYSYVVCGYSVAKDAESVPSKPVSFTTNATVEAMAAIGQLGVWSEEEKLWLHTVSAGSMAELDPGVVKLGSAINLTYEWQSRAPSETVWKVVQGEEKSKLVIPNVQEEMNGTEYRLIVKAVYGSGDMAYYYSNAATLRVDKLDSNAKVTLPGVNGVVNNDKETLGKRTNPYTGQADYVTKETEIKENADVTKTGEYQDGSEFYPVYEVSLSGDQKAYFYVKTVTTGGELTKTTTTKYYQLTKNGDAFENPVEVKPSQIAYKYNVTPEAGGEAALEKVTGGDENFKTTAVTKDFDGQKYSLIAVMDYTVQSEGESETRTLDNVTFYYVLQVTDKDSTGKVTGSHAEYYEYNKASLGKKVDDDPTVLKKTASDSDDDDSDDNKLKLVSAVFEGSSDDLKQAEEMNPTVSFYYMDENGYYGKMTTTNGTTWNPDNTFKNVRMMDVLSVETGGAEPAETAEIFTDDLSQFYTYDAQERQTIIHTYSLTGTEVTLNADFTCIENSEKSVNDDINAEFIITNLNTGNVTTVAYDSSGNLLQTKNGNVQATWSAPSAGLYSITANIPNDPTLKNTTCTPVYYLAGDTPTAGNEGTEYQLSVNDDSITYGETVTATLQQRTITRNAVGEKGTDGFEQKYTTTYSDWKSAELSDVYYTVMARGQTEPVKSDTVATGSVSLDDLPAGSYTLSVWESEVEYNIGSSPLASITLTVVRADATLNFETATFNKSHNNISEFGITVDLKGKGKSDDFIITDGKLSSRDYISAKCDRYDEKTGLVKENEHGIFPITIGWTDKAEETGYNEVEGQSYRSYIEARYNVSFATANLDARQDLGTVFFSSGENGTLAASYGGDQRDLNSGESVSYGETVQFSAAPNTGYHVESWTVNGETYNSSDNGDREALSDLGMSLQIIDDTYEILRAASFSESHIKSQPVEGQTEDEVSCLQVSVTFSNQTAKISFDSVGDGTVTASPVKSSSNIENGSNVNYGTSITFTAKPGAGKMVESWSVQHGTEAAQIYTWPDGGAYTENTLTLEDIQGDVKVIVTFTDKVTVNVTASVVNSVEPYDAVSVGTISVSDTTGKQLAKGDSALELQDAVGTLVFNIDITEEALNAVKEWQYKENDAENWTTASGSGSLTEWTYHIDPSKNISTLEVRVLIERTQTYQLNWKIAVPSGKDAADIASLTVKVGETEITTSGQDCTAHIAPEFTLTITDADYYVTGWSINEGGSAVTHAADKLSAKMVDGLTADTTVTVTLAEKPKVTINSVEHGSITVTGTYNGKTETFPHNTDNWHFDPNTKLTVSAQPENNYYVEKIQEQGFSASHGTKELPVQGGTEDITISASFKEKPKLTLPGDFANGTLTVEGTYCGQPKRWTLPSGDNSELHFDPGTKLTVTVTPDNNHYVVSIKDHNYDAAHGSRKLELENQSADVEITTVVAGKPQITAPNIQQSEGSITVKGTYCGANKTWTFPTDASKDRHYDPGTEITVTMTPSKGYVPQIGETDAKTASNSDTYTATFNAAVAQDGVNLATYKFRELDKITVHFFVISEGGWKEPGTEGAVAHGTLSAKVSRKGIDTYNDSGATDGVQVNDPEEHTLELYEGGRIVLTAKGTDGTEHGSSTQNPHNVNFWSADNTGNYVAHYQKDGESEDYFGEVLAITYEQLQSHAADGTFYIGVSFAQAAAKVSYHMASGQSELGTITATIETGEMVNNRGEIGMGAKVTFTADITDKDHYEVKNWIVNDEPTSESGTTFTYTAEGRNVVVELELQGKVLDGFEVRAGENGSAAGVPAKPRYNESVELTATPDAGYQFDGWYLNGTKLENAGATYTLTAEDNGVYEARFKPITGLSVAYAVSDKTGGAIEALANDSIEFTSNDGTLEGGQKITLTLTLTEGWRQKASEPWSNLPAGAEVSDDKLTVIIPKLTETITEPITANVEKIPVYTVTVTQPDSTVQIQAYVDGELQESNSFEVPEGTIVTFKYSYVPGPSTVFNYWIVDGDNRGDEPTLELTIMGHTSVSINTNAGVMFNLTLEAGSAEGTTATGRLSAHVGATDYAVGSYPIPSGSTVTVTANPNADSMVKEWYIDGILQKTESGRTFLELVLPEFTLDKDTTVKVVFESKAEYPNPTSEAGVYTVTDVKSYPSGNNSGVTAGSYRKGGDLSFTITPTGDKDILIPYVDGFINAGENVTITENATGGWDVVIKNVTGEVELPNFRVNMEEGITKVPAGLQNQDVLGKLKEYLPDGVTEPGDLTGPVLTEVMERIVVDKMPAAPDSNKAIYDVELQRYDDKANQWVTVTDEDEFPTEGLTVILPYPEGTNRNDTFTVVHMFTTGTDAGTTETFTADSSDHKLTNTSMGIQFHVTSLSPIAVAWTKSAPPAGGGGGGGAAATENPVTLPENVSNGSISSDKETAKEGAEVTLTVTPDWGYAPETVTVTDENGETVEVKDNGDGTYTFTMPATGVKVSVTFGSSCGRDETCPMYSFEDAVRTAWYHDGVHYCLEKGLMDGVGGGKFAPDRTTTRATLVTILYRLEGEPAVTKNIPFEDVPAGQWYSDAVVWAVANGIVKGYNDTEFGPTDTVTREQMAAILYRYSEYKKYDVTATSDLAGYKDADTVSGWADAAMRWAVAEGLIEGTTKTTLVPGNGSTRAMVATVLMRYCEKIAK